jgi:hypothetical protein
VLAAQPPRVSAVFVARNCRGHGRGHAGSLAAARIPITANPPLRQAGSCGWAATPTIVPNFPFRRGAELAHAG